MSPMAVKIPILKIEDVLIASIQTALDDRSVVEFQDDLLEMISKTGATGVVVDITAVDLVDSFMARSLNDIAIAVHLLGAHTVIAGMQPAVAMTLVALGFTMPNALRALNLEKGLKLLRDTFAEETSDHSNGDEEEGAQDNKTISGDAEQAL
jgi:rsbT antagonist protein RsbS